VIAPAILCPWPVRVLPHSVNLPSWYRHGRVVLLSPHFKYL
jgi:hypothetical protein